MKQQPLELGDAFRSMSECTSLTFRPTKSTLDNCDVCSYGNNGFMYLLWWRHIDSPRMNTGMKADLTFSL